MKVVTRVSMLVAVAACSGAATRDAPILHATPAHAACPPAKDVYQAWFLADGHGWVFPLGSEMYAEPLNHESEEATADRPFTAEQTARLVPTRRAWLMIPGKPPCPVTYGKGFTAIVNDGPWNRSFRVELEGCAVPDGKKRVPAMLVLSEHAPSGCTAALATKVSASTSWDGRQPTAPLPAELQGVLPAIAANETRLWRIAAIDTGGKPAVWQVETSIIEVGPDDKCNWPATNLSTLYVRGENGVAPFTYVETRDIGMEVTQHLYGALIDAGGMRALMVMNLGEYQVFDLRASPVEIAHHLRWYVPHEEDFASDGVLGPYCGP